MSIATDKLTAAVVELQKAQANVLALVQKQTAELEANEPVISAAADSVTAAATALSAAAPAHTPAV